MDLLNSQHSAETLNCMYIQESNQKKSIQSITQINQMKSYCGEHRTSAGLPGSKSNDVLRLPSVNNSRIDCLQRLLQSPQAARRTVFTHFFSCWMNLTEHLGFYISGLCLAAALLEIKLPKGFFSMLKSSEGFS